MYKLLYILSKLILDYAPRLIIIRQSAHSAFLFSNFKLMSQLKNFLLQGLELPTFVTGYLEMFHKYHVLKLTHQAFKGSYLEQFDYETKEQNYCLEVLQRKCG